MAEVVEFRVRAPDESFKLEISPAGNLGDLLQALSQRLLKPQRQLELSINADTLVPVNDRLASLAALGLDKGGILRVSLKGDGLLDTKTMFEGILPREGESVQYQEAETQYMKALGRSLEQNAFAGLGLEPELDEKVVKPGHKGIVTGSIADKVVLSNKFPHLAQPGYVPAEPERQSKAERNSRSKAREKRSRSRGKRKKKSTSRSKSRDRRRRSKSKERKHRRSRSRSHNGKRNKKDKRSSSHDRHKNDKGRTSRSRSKAKHRRSREKDQRGRRKEQEKRSKSRSNNVTKDNKDNPEAVTSNKDYLSLNSSAALEVPKRLLEQQEEKALAVRAKLTKPKPTATTTPEDDNDDDTKVSAARALVIASRKRNLNAIAAADEDFTATNRIKNVFKKKFSNDVETAKETGTTDGGLQMLRSNLNRTQDRQSVLAAFEDDTQRDLSSVHDLLLPGAKPKLKHNKTEFAPRDIDQDHFNAIFCPPASHLPPTSDPTPAFEVVREPEKPRANWRERAKALAQQRQKNV